MCIEDNRFVVSLETKVRKFMEPTPKPELIFLYKWVFTGPCI